MSMAEERSQTTDWRTRADPEWTATYGVDELHIVLFEPNDDRPGRRETVMVQIPEASRQQVRQALKQANKLRARLGFICDTREQADAIAETAGTALSSHRRIAYERAEAGGWGLNHA